MEKMGKQYIYIYLINLCEGNNAALVFFREKKTAFINSAKRGGILWKSYIYYLNQLSWITTHFGKCTENKTARIIFTHYVLWGRGRRRKKKKRNCFRTTQMQLAVTM